MNLKDYSITFHRSLIQRDLILGIPPLGLMLLLIISVFTIYILQLYFFAVIVVLLYIGMRLMTKADPYLIDILFEHVNQKDYIIP